MAWKHQIVRRAHRLGLNVEYWPPSSSVPGHLVRLFRRHRVDCVLDVGANEGQFAQSLRGAGYTGRIVSYEPVSEAHRALAVNAADDGAWHVEQVALSDRPGTTELHVSEETQVSSFLTPNAAYLADNPWARVVRTEVVAVERLADRFDADVGGCRSVYLKVDAQGADLQVLRGAEPVLGRVVGLQLEVSVQPIYERQVRYVEALGEVDRLGFVPTGLFPNHRDGAFRLIEMDAVFVRGDLPS